MAYVGQIRRKKNCFECFDTTLVKHLIIYQVDLIILILSTQGFRFWPFKIQLFFINYDNVQSVNNYFVTAWILYICNCNTTSHGGFSVHVKSLLTHSVLSKTFLCKVNTYTNETSINDVLWAFFTIFDLLTYLPCPTL